MAIGDDIKFAKERFKDPAVRALATNDPFWAEVSERQRAAAAAAAEGAGATAEEGDAAAAAAGAGTGSS